MTSSPQLVPRAPDSSINHAHSLLYWNSVPSDINGMLGGYPQTSRIDLQGSSNFLTKLRRAFAGTERKSLEPLDRVADCGAGIGRVARGLLMRVARTVDVVEPVRKFTDELMLAVGAHESDDNDEEGRIGEVYNLGLQDWTPEARAYDLIWNQWCLGHLTDAQLVVYLRRCKDGLKQSTSDAGDGKSGGWIVVKENMSSDRQKRDIFDDEDSSVTRSDDKFRKLFKEAGLKIVATELQKGFPKELYPVRMYALRPE
ncbi:hypothetical protein CC78DRAFT_579427 [Lojkania enalia]|uniref:Alpha N-terminal protein methyltransferase 1 n=1 Tax=Lojkania enalia TaxID=147567 RepID=A0A9P4N473_9PLEO|nr:hypothetical protein CC78DRAFT_579427 [Didymosphaeria enalia]